MAGKKGMKTGGHSTGRPPEENRDFIKNKTSIQIEPYRRKLIERLSEGSSFSEKIILLAMEKIKDTYSKEEIIEVLKKEFPKFDEKYLPFIMDCKNDKENKKILSVINKDLKEWISYNTELKKIVVKNNSEVSEETIKKMKKHEIIIIDPEGEYGELIKSMKLNTIKPSPNGRTETKINEFYVSDSFGTKLKLFDVIETTYEDPEERNGYYVLNFSKQQGSFYLYFKSENKVTRMNWSMCFNIPIKENKKKIGNLYDDKFEMENKELFLDFIGKEKSQKIENNKNGVYNFY